MSDESILLKFGSIKDWIRVDPDNYIFHQTIKEYFSEGEHCGSLAFHTNSPKQRQILCRLIDNFQGQIWLDSGDKALTKDEAKNYINGYNS